MNNSKKCLLISLLVLFITVFVCFMKAGFTNDVEIGSKEKEAMVVSDNESIQEEVSTEVDKEVQNELQEETQKDLGNIEETEETEKAIEDMLIPISVQGITTTRLSRKKIQIAWSDRDGDLVELLRVLAAGAETVDYRAAIS